MASKVNPKLFTTRYSGLSNKLINQVTLQLIEDEARIFTYNALWDTGATSTVIRKSVAMKMGLSPVSKKIVNSASHSSECYTYLVNLILPNGVRMLGVEVTGMDLPGGDDYDLLIGMNVINAGDFQVSNFDGKTFFSFRIPSLSHADFVTKYNNRTKRSAKRSKKRKR